MKAINLPAVVAALVVLFPGVVRAQPVAATMVIAVDRQTTDAAATGLSTLRALVRQMKNFREMGFEAIEDLDRATLGEPLIGYMVRLDELGGFKAGTDPARLIHATKQVLFPVLVDGKVRSSVTVSAGEKGWTATGFGSPAKAAMAVRTREVSVKATSLASSTFVLVEVPAMKLVFIGYSSGGSLLLTPLADYPAFQLKADVPARADELFLRLAPATRAFTDGPG